MKASTKKIVILIIVIVVFSVGAVFIALRVHEQRTERELNRIAEAYWRVNLWHYAGGTTMTDSSGRNTAYRPFREISAEVQRFEICVWTYLYLKLYERETGNVVTFEALVDYFSQEFEPDGSLRLYNNGNHPEIQAVVEWLWEFPRETSDVYIWYINRIFREYRDSHEGTEFDGLTLFHLSPQMLDALVRAEADPNYVLDLTSLQRAGY